MLQQVPHTITVTDLQRDPKIIDRINKRKKEVFVLKGSKQMGVYIPISTYQKQVDEFERLIENTKLEPKEEKNKELERDLKKIRELAGGLKLPMDYTPEQLNEIFEKSYERDIQMLS